MKIPPVKGTRDFYPSEMAVHNFIVEGWKAASVRNGFEQYDGPIFEYLQMFQIKSGEEIVEQLFSLKDRGGRDLAIRPEITPTLARMVNQQINSLPRPIKWFSVPRLCRAERPQKGRLREFFQWNIDIIDVDDSLADAEVIFTTIDYLRQAGLTANDIKARISSRRLLSAFLNNIGVAKKDVDAIYALLDKKSKLPAETFRQLMSEKVPDAEMASKITAFTETDTVGDVEKIVDIDKNMEIALDELTSLFRCLNDDMEVGQYCVFDPGIVRGLAYYTGIVFEVHDAQGQLRAICGGGRYDNLLKELGGPLISATGMGMGDCVLELLLQQRGLIEKQLKPSFLDYFIACVPDVDFFDKDRNIKSTSKQKAVAIATKLRGLGFSADFSYKNSNLGKQLKEASARNAEKCVIVGDELKDGKIVVKGMKTGRQELVVLDDFFARIKI